MSKTISKKQFPQAQKGVVKRMRKIRDRMGQEIQGMSTQEMNEYFKKEIEKGRAKDK